MPPEAYFTIITALETAILKMKELKNAPEAFDGRSVSIAITETETAQLWITNALKQE